LFSRKVLPPDFGEMIGFSNGKVDNSTLIQWFCAKLGPSMLKFRGAGPYWSQIIWGRTKNGFSKNVKFPLPPRRVWPEICKKWGH